STQAFAFPTWHFSRSTACCRPARFVYEQRRLERMSIPGFLSGFSSVCAPEPRSTVHLFLERTRQKRWKSLPKAGGESSTDSGKSADRGKRNRRPTAFAIP